MIEASQKISVEELLNNVKYGNEYGYVPSDFALGFVNFIKLVEDGDPENKTPVVHYKMLDKFVEDNGKDTINLCHRGIAKSTLLEYLILYIAVFKTMPGFKTVPYLIYVSDSIDNGVKKMRKSLEKRYYKSQFLKKYIKDVSFTDIRWEFFREDGESLVVSGYGAKSGVRGPLSLDSLVYTDNGTKTIETVEVGDLIYTPKGTLTKVTGKSEVFTDSEMYKLVFDDGRELKCDGTHLHPLYVRKITKGKTEYVKKLFTTNELLAGAPLVNGTYRRYFTQAVEPVQYSEKALPLDPYLLGLLLGDGFVNENKSARLAGIKEDVEEYLKHLNYPAVSETDYFERSGLPMKRVTFLDTKDVMVELGLSGKIDKEKSIPALYQRGSVNQRRALLAGLLDTDGTCSKDEGSVSYSTISEQLANDIAELARSLGYLVRSTCIVREGRQPIYRVYFRGDVNPFKLERKRALFRVPAKRSKRVALLSIERITNQPCQCIRVEDDEHEFITDNYLATHNTRENNTRPVIALLDDLVSDEDAKSPTVIANIEDTVYKAIDYALHPKKRKIIWNGTPFNAKDPLYKAVESGAWNVNVFPVCEEFPCTEEEFRGSWPDRFDYEYVKRMYQKALDSGKVDTFNQELMLRILSEEDRVISESDIQWYSRKTLIENKAKFNYYITTDFATSEKTTGDFSVISVWACNSNQDWFWVDGIVKRQLMDANIDDLFRFVHKWKPQEVGVEISGQQKGFISWIQNEMIRRNIYFTLASDNNGGSPGIRPVTNKMQRFNVVQPWFKLKKFRFPEELRRDPRVVEFITELTLITEGGFKSKHDDCIDTVSMLGVLRPWYPSEETQFVERGTDGMWDIEDEKIDNNISSYIV